MPVLSLAYPQVKPLSLACPQVNLDGQTLEIRGMADLMSFPPLRIDMQVFSRPDIARFLEESGFPASPDRAIDLVQNFSRGVPFAVELLTDALRRIGDREEILKEFADPGFEKQLRQAASNEEVIRQVPVLTK